MLTKGTLRHKGGGKIPWYCIFIETDPNVAQREGVSQAKYIMVSRSHQLLPDCVSCTVKSIWSWFAVLIRKVAEMIVSSRLSLSNYKQTKIQSGISLILYLFLLLFFCLFNLQHHPWSWSPLSLSLSGFLLSWLIFYVVRFSISPVLDRSQPGQRFFQKFLSLINRLIKIPLLEYYIFNLMSRHILCFFYPNLLMYLSQRLWRPSLNGGHSQTLPGRWLGFPILKILPFVPCSNHNEVDYAAIF